VVQDLWILLNSGQVLYNRVFEEKIDPNLFCAMMSVLEIMAQELSEGGLTNFEMNNKSFSLLKKNDILFIASYTNKNKENRVNKELELIVKKFFKLYDLNLLTFAGEITKFKDFEEEIEDSLESLRD